MDGNDLFTLMEGVDPLRVVATDTAAAQALAAAYGQPAVPGEHGRLFGRDIVAFHRFEDLLDDATHKQKAWALLKSSHASTRTEARPRPAPCRPGRACPEEARPSRVFGSGILPPARPAAHSLQPARPTTCSQSARAARASRHLPRTRRRRAGATPPSPRGRRRPTGRPLPPSWRLRHTRAPGARCPRDAS